MIDLSDLISTLEDAKTKLEKAQKELVFSESAQNSSEKMQTILEKTISARKDIRTIFLESSKSKNVKEAIENYGEANSDIDAKKIVADFEKYISKIENEIFSNLVCTDEIHAALNEMNATEQQTFLKKIAEKYPELYNRIYGSVFIFSDIQNLSDRAIQKILREVDSQTVAHALVGADTEIQEKFFSNISENAAETLREDIEYLGGISKSDREECRNAICRTVLRLFDSGEIDIHKGADSDFENDEVI